MTQAFTPGYSNALYDPLAMAGYYKIAQGGNATAASAPSTSWSTFTVQLCPSGAAAGQTVFDLTQQNARLGTLVACNGNKVTLSANASAAGAVGDAIVFMESGAYTATVSTAPNRSAEIALIDFGQAAGLDASGTPTSAGSTTLTGSSSGMKLTQANDLMVGVYADWASSHTPFMCPSGMTGRYSAANIGTWAGAPQLLICDAQLTSQTPAPSYNASAGSTDATIGVLVAIKPN